jgi:hypothetical protein
MPGFKRSPKCPFIDLKKAIERARTLYRKEGRNGVAVPIAVSHWGYKPKTSGGLQTVAALKGYGLVEYSGKGDDRHVQLTKLALRILLDEREDSPDRARAIQEAALRPKLFSELWDKWKDQGLPSPVNMRHILIFEKEFNENSAQDFVLKFADTIHFAGLTASTSTDAEDGDKSLIQSAEASVPKDQADKARRPVDSDLAEQDPLGSRVRLGVKQDIFTLEEGRIVLQWPERLSASSLEDFEDWWQLMLRKVRRSVKAESKNQ